MLPSGIEVQTGYVITINNVQRQHAGIYHCTAANDVGQPVTGEIALHVLCKCLHQKHRFIRKFQTNFCWYSRLFLFSDPPEVNVLRSWVNSGEGLEAKLDCVVHADPPAEVRW